MWAKRCRSPFISYLAGTLAALAVCVLVRYPLPTATALSGTSWWMWTGGCLGTAYVWATLFATPKIGAALALALTFVGQMMTALFLDQYGALGLAKIPATPERIAGIVLMILGVSLVAYVKR